MTPVAHPSRKPCVCGVPTTGRGVARARWRVEQMSPASVSGASAAWAASLRVLGAARLMRNPPFWPVSAAAAPLQQRTQKPFVCFVEKNASLQEAQGVSAIVGLSLLRPLPLKTVVGFGYKAKRRSSWDLTYYVLVLLF